MTTRTAELLPGTPSVQILTGAEEVGSIRLELGPLAIAIDLRHVDRDGIVEDELCADVTATLDLPFFGSRQIVDTSGCWDYGEWLDAIDHFDWI